MLVLTILVSCGSKKYNIENDSAFDMTPKLIFLNFKIDKTNNNDRKLTLINKIVTNGKLKDKSSSNDFEEVGDLRCNQLDKNNEVLQSQIVKNPLKRIIEYTDESGAFQVARLPIDSAQVSLKLKLIPNTKYITISDIRDKDKTPETLIKIPVN